MTGKRAETTAATLDRAVSRRRLVASIAFLAVVAVALALTSAVLKPARKGNASGCQWPAYLTERPGSIDVLYFGTSHAFAGIDPGTMFETDGITGFVMAGATQEFQITEYYVRETLRTQKPKVVVLEMAAAAYDGTNRNRAFQRINVAYMPWGMNRVRATFDGTQPGDRVWALVDLWPLHGRPNGLTWSDFDIAGKNRGFEYLKGFKPTCKAKVVTSTPAALTDAKRREADREIAYNMPALRRIVRLCDEQGIEVLLLLTPTSPPGGYEYHLEGVHRKLAAESGNVRALDLDAPGAVPGLSYEKDFRDVGHLKYTGAEKVAPLIARFLADTYDLPDHRGDPAYADWREDVRLRDEYIRSRGGRRR